MTVTGPSLSPVSDILQQAYGIAPERPVPLGGGYRNEIWRTDDVVVRVERAPTESVAWEHELVNFLAPRVDEVVAPIRAADDATFVLWQQRVVSVWPYVDGAPARRRHEPHAVAAAELLARLHAACREWDGVQRPGWDATVAGHPVGPIHGDFYRGNLLVRRGRIVGILDWEEAHVDSLDYELANAVWQFAVSKREHDFDRRLARAMIEAYGSDLHPDDLVPLIVARLRYERDVWGAESDETYQRHLRRSIEKLDG